MEKQITAFGMKKATIDPDAFAEAIITLDRWKETHSISADLEKKYREKRNRISELFGKRYNNNQGQLEALVKKLRTEQDTK